MNTPTLNCMDGDLALIAYDEPSCEANIGRVVHVRGPLKYSGYYGLVCWLIKPVHRVRWQVSRDGEVSSEIVYWNSYIEHPDAWMVPLRTPAEDDHDGEPTGVPEPAPDEPAEIR